MITAIVVAAGKSSRMGPINKMLLPFGQSTVIGTVVANLHSSNVDEIIIVESSDTGVSEHLESNPKLSYVINHEASTGLTSSIQCGVQASSEGTDGYLICLGDMPLITTEEYNLLINNSLVDGDKVIHIPYFNKRRGNPVLFSSYFKKEILALKDSTGCRPIVQTNQDFVKQINFPTDYCLRDIDTMEDYKNLSN